MDSFGMRAKPEVKADARTEKLATAALGAAIEVHRHLGPGLPEEVYPEALIYELGLRGVECQREVPVPIHYKGKLVGHGRIDLLVGGSLILELKVVECLNQVHRAQVISYLQATKLKLALLINFNVAILKDGIKRIINTY